MADRQIIFPMVWYGMVFAYLPTSFNRVSSDGEEDLWGFIKQSFSMSFAIPNQSFIYSYMLSFIHLFIFWFIHKIIHPFIHSIIHSCDQPLIQSFVYSFIYSVTVHHIQYTCTVSGANYVSDWLFVVTKYGDKMWWRSVSLLWEWGWMRLLTQISWYI